MAVRRPSRKYNALFPRRNSHIQDIKGVYRGGIVSSHCSFCIRFMITSSPSGRRRPYHHFYSDADEPITLLISNRIGVPSFALRGRVHWLPEPDSPRKIWTQFVFQRRVSDDHAACKQVRVRGLSQSVIDGLIAASLMAGWAPFFTSYYFSSWRPQRRISCLWVTRFEA